MKFGTRDERKTKLQDYINRRGPQKQRSSAIRKNFTRIQKENGKMKLPKRDTVSGVSSTIRSRKSGTYAKSSGQYRSAKQNYSSSEQSRLARHSRPTTYYSATYQHVTKTGAPITVSPYRVASTNATKTSKRTRKKPEIFGVQRG